MNDNMVIYNLAGAVSGSGSGGGADVEVINNLDSTSTVDALSANMGRILNITDKGLQAQINVHDSSILDIQGQVNSIGTALTEEINTRDTSDTAILKKLNTEIDERKAADTSIDAIIPKTTETIVFTLTDGTTIQKTFYVV